MDRGSLHVVVPNIDAGEWISEGTSPWTMWCPIVISCRDVVRRDAVRRPEELGGARDWLDASKQGTQNLVDSYTEVVPKALEVLPSETRHRI
jgi:hypothetical protein